jgi:perosamine synthetase
MTTITIPDMIEIVRRHGLIPIPLDLEFNTLAPSVDALQRILAPATRLIVVAHLFGVKSPMSPILEIAKKNDLIVVEDCAQSFIGPEAMVWSDSDASFYSFGPIKTATALGGAIVRVRDAKILAEMQRRQDQYPVQRQRSYAVRLMKYAALKFASQRMLYGCIMYTCRYFKRDPDLLVNSLARNFGKRDLFESIRRQPCKALVAMLARRWRSYDSSRFERRVSLGDYLKGLIKDSVAVPGYHAECHSYWVFPIVVDSFEVMIESLRQHGFDATSSHNLTSLDPVADGSNRDAPVMAQMLRNVVFLPIYPEMTYVAIERMARIITQQVSERSKSDLG